MTSHFGFFRILDVKIEVMREKKKEKKEKNNALLEPIQTSPIHTWPMWCRPRRDNSNDTKKHQEKTLEVVACTAKLDVIHPTQNKLQFYNFLKAKMIGMYCLVWSWFFTYFLLYLPLYVRFLQFKLLIWTVNSLFIPFLLF